MIDLGRETDGNNGFLGVRFALCIIKALRLARIEHCSGTVVTRFLKPSFTENNHKKFGDHSTLIFFFNYKVAF